MSLLSAAALFLLANSLVSPARACLDAGQVTTLCFSYFWLIVHRCDAAIGLGYAAHVGIGIGVVILVILVVCLIVFQRRKHLQLQQAQANGSKPYDIGHDIEQGHGASPVSVFNQSQVTIAPEPTFAKEMGGEKENSCCAGHFTFFTDSRGNLPA
ncbi:hypothetical protein JB92DRAFT_3121625 [Gautieria morchelliformis]|nr:hypothetical protein JB92DRAFT_3121625 [Gautieria morchelliformis]